MKFTCKTKEFKKAIESVLPGIDPRPTLESLRCIRINVLEGKAELSATNINNYYQSHMEVTDTEKGSTLVRGDQIYNIIKACDTDDVNCDYTKEGLKLTAGKAEFTLPVMKDEEFPEPPTAKKEAEYKLELSGEEFKEIIRKTAYAVSKDEHRPLFTGIYMDITDGSVSFVGTNTHRISVYKVEGPEVKNKCNVNIPATIMTNVTKLLDDKETVTISFVKNLAKISTDNWSVNLTSIEGKFPDYSRIIPAKSATIITINREKLSTAVNRVSLLSSSENGYHIVRLEIKNDHMVVHSYGRDSGNGKETLECVTEGPELDIAFNAKYLLEYCRSSTADEIKICLNNSSSPAAIYEKDTENYTYVLTPIRAIFN